MPIANPRRTALSISSISIHPTYARMLCLVLRNLRVDVDGLLSGVGMSWAELSTSDRMLGLEDVQRLGMAAIRASQRPWLGLDLGQSIQTAMHGPVGYAVASSRDLRQALETLSEFGALRNAALSFQMEPVPGGIVLHVHQTADLGELRHMLADVVFAALVRVMESVAGPDLDGVTIHVPRAEPEWAERYRRLFAGQLRFNTDHLALEVDDALLNRPNFSADVQDFDSARRACERALSEATHHQDATTASLVREWLETKPDTYPSLEQMAHQLNISSRTLMRRLKQEGTSFQQLIDALRRERATWYLQQTHLTVEDIAARLGYIDTSNFSRTFRKWFAMTPLEMRKLSTRRPTAPSP